MAVLVWILALLSVLVVHAASPPTGMTVQDYCNTNPCLNDARCVEDPASPGQFLCLCGLGWTGDLCEMQVASGWTRGVRHKIEMTREGACFLRQDARINCFGGPSAVVSNYPWRLYQSTGFMQISCGAHACYGLTTSGQTYLWGDFVTHISPAFDTNITPLIQISMSYAEYQYTCGLDRSGFPHCWYENRQLQTVPPSALQSRTVMLQVETYGDGACGLRTDGSITCWGALAAGIESSLTGLYSSISGGVETLCGVSLTDQVECFTGSIGSVMNVSALNDYSGYQANPRLAIKLILAVGNAVCVHRVDGSVQCAVGDYDSVTSGLMDMARDGPWMTIGTYQAGLGSCGMHYNGTVRCYGQWKAGREKDDFVPSSKDYDMPVMKKIYTLSRTSSLFPGAVVCSIDLLDSLTCRQPLPAIFYDPISFPLPIPNVKHVELGSAQLCWLTLTGEIGCYVNTMFPDAGAGLDTNRPTGSGYTQLRCTDFYSENSIYGRFCCALRPGENLECWGPGYMAPVVYGVTVGEWYIPADTAFTDFGVGQNSVICGIYPDNTLLCYGPYYISYPFTLLPANFTRNDVRTLSVLNAAPGLCLIYLNGTLECPGLESISDLETPMPQGLVWESVLVSSQTVCGKVQGREQPVCFGRDYWGLPPAVDPIDVYMGPTSCHCVLPRDGTQIVCNSHGESGPMVQNFVWGPRPRLSPRDHLYVDAVAGVDQTFCGFPGFLRCRTVPFALSSTTYSDYPTHNYALPMVTVHQAAATITPTATVTFSADPANYRFGMILAGAFEASQGYTLIDCSNVTSGFCLDFATTAAWAFYRIRGASNGAIFVGVSASLTLINCIVEDNVSPEESAVVAVTESALAMFATIVRNNRVLFGSGGAGVQLSEPSLATFIGCTFENNRAEAGYGGAVFVIQVTSSFSRCDFINNFSGIGGGAVAVSASFATFLECRALGNVAEDAGGFLDLLPSIASDPSEALLIDCDVHDNTAVRGGAIASEQSSLAMSESQLYRNHAAQDGGAISLIDSEAIILDCDLTGNSAGSNDASECAGVLFDPSFSQPNIGGGAISCFGTGAMDASLVLSASSVLGNTATNGAGGGVFAVTCDTSIDQGTSLVNNSALSGGALFVAGVQNAHGSWAHVTSTVFDGNRAQCRGGAVVAFQAQMTASANVYTNNVAGGLGGVFFSDGPMNISGPSVCAGNRHIATDVSSCTVPSSSASSLAVRNLISPFARLTPGDIIFPAQFDLRDAQNNVILDDNGFSIASVTLIRSADPSDPGNFNQNFHIPFAAGVAAFSEASANGATASSGIAIYGPNGTYSVAFQASVTLFDGSVRALYLARDFVLKRCAPGWKYDLTLRRCQQCPIAAYAGDYTSCVACPAGTRGLLANDTSGYCFACQVGRYSGIAAQTTCAACDVGKFEFLEGSRACQTCPERGSCANNIISYSSGLWLLDAGHDDVSLVQCPPQLCFGSGMCQPGRDVNSPLCGSCLEGLYEWNDQCVPCPDGTDSGLIFGLIVASWTYVLFIHFSAQSKGLSFLKVLMFFTQVSLYLVGDSARWIGWVEYFNISPYSLTGGDACPAALGPWQKLAVTMLTPIGFLVELGISALVARAMWSLRCYPERLCRSQTSLDAFEEYHNNKQTPHFAWKPWQRSLGALLIFTYTQFTTNTISYFNCVTVGNPPLTPEHTVVYSTPALDCNSDAYPRWLAVVIIIFVLDVVLFPAVVALTLFRRRKLLQGAGSEAQTKQFGWGIFFESYSPNAVWYEPVALFRRLAYAVVGTAASQSPYRFTLLALLSWIFLAVHVHLRPFSAHTDNTAETVSLGIICILCALLSPGQYPYPEGVQVLISILVLIPTLAALVWLAYLLSWRLCPARVKLPKDATADSEAEYRKMRQANTVKSREVQAKHRGHTASTMTGGSRPSNGSMLSPLASDSRTDSSTLEAVSPLPSLATVSERNVSLSSDPQPQLVSNTRASATTLDEPTSAKSTSTTSTSSDSKKPTKGEIELTDVNVHETSDSGKVLVIQ